MQWLNNLFPPATDTNGYSASSQRAGGAPSTATFSVGDVVEYFSATQNAWIPAQVLAIRGGGVYDLDCKPGVEAEKIRACASKVSSVAAPAGATGYQQFETNSLVEYYSESQGAWILAKVLGYNNVTGMYNLDCKPNVPASKLRRAPEGTQAAAMPGSASNLQSTGVLGTANFGIPEPPLASPPAVSSTSPPSTKAGGWNSYETRGPVPRLPPAGPVGELPRQDQPLQLVKVFRDGSRWQFEVNEEAAKVLEAYGQRRVAVCTVCGPYRTGKSYLLNLLLGRIQRGQSQFRVGSTTRACTEGIWMWGNVGDNTSAGRDSPTLIFMDCEGFGSTDSDKTRDAKLMSLCMLLSSVFLLNTKGVLSEGLFNALSLVCHLAEHVEERGSEASKPALLWLLRDFVLELRDDTGRTLTSDEYLEQSLHAKPLANTDAERSRAAREVRESLLKFFPERHCATLVQPVIEEDKLQQLSDLPYEHLRREFRQQLEDMHRQVLQLARAHPKTVAGHSMGGVELVAMLRKLVEGVNTNQALNVQNAWDGVQHTACASLLEELREAAVTELRKVANGAALPVPNGRPLPVRDDELAKALKQARRALRVEFAQRAVGDEKVRGEYWRELKESIQGDEQALERQNRKLAEEQLRAAGADWEAWLAEEGEATSSDKRSEALAELVDQGLPAQPLGRAAREAINTARLARLRFDGRLNAVKAETKLLADELESRKAVSSSAAGGTTSTSDEALERTRELGRLQGQVEALQNQARENATRQQDLREQVIKAEDEHRKAVRERDEALDALTRRDERVKQLEQGIERVRNEADEKLAAKRKADAEPAKPAQQPKCGCVVS